MAARPLNILSICHGRGGLDWGVGLAVPSARVVCGVEWDAYACAVVVAGFEAEGVAGFPLWSDLRTFDGRRWRGVVDCVTAGIPCQGNSMAGKRLLEDDERNMWPDTRRVLREVGPEWFFLENVGGFLVPDRGAGRSAPIARVLGELAEDGWDMADRRDRLRVAGNGVVPLVAAHAFRTLRARFGQ